MSGYVAGLCYEVKFGCATLKAIAVALADHASQDGTKVFPSVSLLARKVEVSDRTVQRSLRKLEAMGVLKIVRDGGAGPGNTREWLFDLHLLRTVAAGELTLTLPDDKGDTVSPLEDELRVTPVSAKGDTDDIKGDTGVTRTVTNLQEPSSAPLPPSPVEPPQSGQSANLNLKGPVRAVLRIRPHDVGWTQWIEHIEAKLGDRAADAAAAQGELEVTTRWPNDDTPMPIFGRAWA